jgi:GAF domain-containing protein
MKSTRSPLEYFGILPESSDATLLRLVLSTAVDAIGADEGSLLLRDKGTGDLRFAMTVGDPDSEAKLMGERVPAGKGLVQEAVVTQRAVTGAPTFRDIKQTERESGGPEAEIAAPMISSGSEVIGVLTGVTFKHGRRFDEHDAKLYGGLATLAAVLIEQHQRISGMEGRSAILATAIDPRHNRELSEIDQALSRITAQHPEVLSQIAAIIANVEAAIRR